jgi:hypothetical protein
MHVATARTMPTAMHKDAAERTCQKVCKQFREHAGRADCLLAIATQLQRNCQLY